MICSMWEKNGRVGSVTVEMIMQTQAHYPITWDREGTMAMGDKNKVVSHFLCSNGHQWTSSSDDQP